MKRREFITLLGSAAAAWPLAARAQQPERMRRIGVLMGPENDAGGQTALAAFQESLRKLGWIEGRNVELDIRWLGVAVERRRLYAAEMVSRAPDVILAAGAPTAIALKQEKDRKR